MPAKFLKKTETCVIIRVTPGKRYADRPDKLLVQKEQKHDTCFYYGELVHCRVRYSKSSKNKLREYQSIFSEYKKYIISINDTLYDTVLKRIKNQRVTPRIAIDSVRKELNMDYKIKKIANETLLKLGVDEKQRKALMTQCSNSLINKLYGSENKESVSLLRECVLHKAREIFGIKALERWSPPKISSRVSDRIWQAECLKTLRLLRHELITNGRLAAYGTFGQPYYKENSLVKKEEISSEYEVYENKKDTFLGGELVTHSIIIVGLSIELSCPDRSIVYYLDPSHKLHPNKPVKYFTMTYDRFLRELRNIFQHTLVVNIETEKGDILVNHTEITGGPYLTCCKYGDIDGYLDKLCFEKDFITRNYLMPLNEIAKRQSCHKFKKI